MDPVTAAAIAGVVSAGSSLIGALNPPDAPAAPEPTPAPVAETPTTMPSANDEQARLAKQRSIAQQIARRGRASTILTDTGGTLGAG